MSKPTQDTAKKKVITTPRLVSTSTAAEYYDVTIGTIHRWVRKGKLKSQRSPGGRKLILLADPKMMRVEEILASGRK